MRTRTFLLLALCLFALAVASPAGAAGTLTRLGEHPFCKTPLTSEEDLRSMIASQQDDLQIGFARAGVPDLYQDFFSQFPSAEIDTVTIQPGEEFRWMLFKRNHGAGPVMAVKDVTWGGGDSFKAYRFFIDQGDQRHEFIIPVACGNLSLRNTGPIPPAQVAGMKPRCVMRLSSTEIACGETITVDATGSSDQDGSIAAVVFQVLDASNQVVLEKRDNEAPFIQDLTIPCESSSYTVKAVVIDNTGAQSSPAECRQQISFASRIKGGPLFDVGVARQFDPATYLFGRIGYEYPLSAQLSAMGFVGGFGRIEGDDGGSAFIVDALLTYDFTETMFAGAGLGFWAGDDDNLDIIVNVGYRLAEWLKGFETSLFIEGRFEADDLISSEGSRLGIGLRFNF